MIGQNSKGGNTGHRQTSLTAFSSACSGTLIYVDTCLHIPQRHTFPHLVRIVKVGKHRTLSDQFNYVPVPFRKEPTLTILQMSQT